MTDQEEGFAFVDKRGARTDLGDLSAQQAENEAKLDADQGTDQPAVDSSPSESEDAEFNDEEPPDTYSLISYCVSLLASDAWQKLGLVAGPKAGEAQADLKQAKVAIDAVGELAAHLEAAPPEAIPENLRRELRVLMQDLRLNFVAQQNKPQ